MVLITIVFMGFINQLTQLGGPTLYEISSWDQNHPKFKQNISLKCNYIAYYAEMSLHQLDLSSFCLLNVRSSFHDSLFLLMVSSIP